MKPENDPNCLTYQRLLKSDELFNRYKDKHVAIVDGAIVDNDLNRENLLQRVRENYANKPAYVSKVTREIEVYDFNDLELIILE